MAVKEQEIGFALACAPQDYMAGMVERGQLEDIGEGCSRGKSGANHAREFANILTSVVTSRSDFRRF